MRRTIALLAAALSVAATTTANATPAQLDTIDAPATPTEQPTSTPAPIPVAVLAPALEKAWIPATVKESINGRLREEWLVVVVDGGEWEMLDYAARQMRGFIHEASAVFGRQLTFVRGSANAYRTFARQEAMFFERYRAVSSGGSRSYLGRRWALRKGMAGSATPGLSNHGWGIAGDMCWTVGGADVAITAAEREILRPIAARYGISDTVSSEPWHWVVMFPMVGVATPSMSAADAGTWSIIQWLSALP